jgi:hypothetical protein
LLYAGSAPLNPEQAVRRLFDQGSKNDPRMTEILRPPMEHGGEEGSVMSAVQESSKSGQASAGQLTPDAAGAIDFLERWTDGAEPRALLVSILPDSRTTRGHTFDLPGDGTMARWIESCNRVSGVYWTTNACEPDLMKKALKADVDWLLGVWGDLDPLKGRDLRGERQRLHRLAEELMVRPWPPTVIIDSGGGIQPIWRLAEPVEAHAEYVEAIETLGRRIECLLGGVENTCNIDRILRLPFTINHPNKLKIDQGRVPVMSDILGETGRRYSWAELETLAAHLEDEPPLNAIPVPFKRRNNLNGNGSIHLDGLPDYPTEDQVEALFQNHPSVRQIWDQSTPYPPDDPSPSGWDQSFASTLAAIGLSPENIRPTCEPIASTTHPRRASRTGRTTSFAPFNAPRLPTPRSAKTMDRQTTRANARPTTPHPTDQGGTTDTGQGRSQLRATLRTRIGGRRSSGRRSRRRRTGRSPASSASPTQRPSSRPGSCRRASGGGSRRRPRTWAARSTSW